MYTIETMKRGRFIKWLLSFVGILLLTTIVVPHHHHKDDTLAAGTHCQDQRHTDDKDAHFPCSDSCPNKLTYSLKKNQDEHVLSYQNLIDNDFPFLVTAILFDQLLPDLLTILHNEEVRYAIAPDASLYCAWVPRAHSLRAPPAFIM